MANNHSDNGHGHGGHSHGLTRSDDVKGVSDARLLWSVVLNQLLTVGQVVAGIVSGSVALLSDAAHNFNDANLFSGAASLLPQLCLGRLQ